MIRRTNIDMQKFIDGLKRLLHECGAELAEPPELTLRRPEHEGFVGTGMELDGCHATRERQPIEIRITVKAEVAGNWHHNSGDDRRLHPDLRSNAELTGDPLAGRLG